MKPKLLPETVEAITNFVLALTGESIKSIHVNQPRICDHCLNADDEAFPYGVYDRDSRFWQDLCNDCFDALGCAYPTGEVPA